MSKELEIMGVPAVQAHIAMLQKVIGRMANNSANCKTWTVTIVSAMLVLLVKQETEITDARILFIPIALFYFLDCYYLGLERLCILSQKNFLNKVAEEEVINNLYTIAELSSRKRQLKSMVTAIFSFSTSPFYLIVALLFFLMIK